MLRLVLAEDDSALRTILAKSLTIAGFSVTASCDGREALEELQRERADLLLTDIHMPRLNGLELCRLLRADKNFTDLGIVVLTATTAQDNLFEILRQGADAWIAKPYNREQLVTTLREVAKRRRFVQHEYVLGNWLEIDISSSLQVVNSINIFIALLLAQSPMGEDEIRKMGFAISELLLNAMEHGHGFEEKLRVHCSFVLFDQCLIFKIEDQGSGFVPSLVPNPVEDPIGVALSRAVEGKRPGGYGISMASKFAEISFSEKGNTVLLTKKF